MNAGGAETDRVEAMDAESAIRWAVDRYHPRLAFAASFGAEDVVVADLLLRARPDARVFMLDTGRLPIETLEVAERIRVRYSAAIEAHVPEREAVERLEREKGLFSFRDSLENREECCRLRKVEPLRRALAGLELWITGVRRDQSSTRAAARRLEWDEAHGLWKLNPIVDWDDRRVWERIRARALPYNALHDRGFPSIGCAPCTRAVAEGEDPRAGRWWWERDEHKECGLHRAEGSRPGTARTDSGRTE